jgi:hypothetical protein
LPLPDAGSKRPAFRFQEQATRVSDDHLRIGEVPVGTFKLSAPAPAADRRCLPLRGDLAHIRLAGKYFVPHYVAPLVRTVAGGAALKAKPQAEAETCQDLAAGTAFNVLDIAGGWAWGQVDEDGFVGYLPLDTLEQRRG